MTGRRWTIEDVGCRPLTVNRVMGLHRQQWARHTADVRRRWTFLALAARVDRLDACTVTATPLHRDGRSPQDVAACAPEVKAAVDGLVDAGVIADDTARHLRAVTFTAPDVCGRDGLRLTIEEARR